MSGTQMARYKDRLFCGRPWVECHYCGSYLTIANATVDHVRPIAHGGENKLGNLVLACRRCNADKKNMSYGRFLKRMRHFQVA